jgi:hypothetical protein
VSTISTGTGLEPLVELGLRDVDAFLVRVVVDHHGQRHDRDLVAIPQVAGQLRVGVGDEPDHATSFAATIRAAARNLYRRTAALTTTIGNRCSRRDSGVSSGALDTTSEQ